MVVGREWIFIFECQHFHFSEVSTTTWASLMTTMTQFSRSTLLSAEQTKKFVLIDEAEATGIIGPYNRSF